MEIHSIGYHHSHDADFLMEKPNGIGQAWLFLLFHTKAMVRIDKTERIVPPNSFLLFYLRIDIFPLKEYTENVKKFTLFGRKR